MINSLFPTVILAGGLATRLRPLTETIPKSLVDINGEPFVAHQLRLLRKNNIKKVIFCIGYLGDMLIEYVGDGRRFDMQVEYVKDGPVLLGTAGAIKKALPYLDDSFFVLYGDSYLPCYYSEVQASYIHSGKNALMTIFKNEGQWDTSNVEFSSGNILKYDKVNRTVQMQYIDYGLGIFSKNIFEEIPDGQPYDLALLYQNLLRNEQLTAHEVKQRFYEVGSFTGIQELSHFLANQTETVI